MRRLILLFPVLIILSCSLWEYEDPSKFLGNKAPETYLSLIAIDTIFATIDSIIFIEDPFSGETIQDTIWRYVIGGTPDTTLVWDTLANAFLTSKPSRQELHWWGEDEDGEIIGYYYRWNTDSNWTYTIKEGGIFFVPITTLFDVFQFEVAAVDNDSLVDATPARLVLPIHNSPPKISFRYRSNPLSVDLPDPNTLYTYPTRTFIWDLEDLDGTETITDVFYALDDTCEVCWVALDAATYSSITLDSISPGSHTFFLKAKDIAGAFSPTILFPDVNDSDYPDLWLVKEPTGKILIVDDYPQDTPNNALNWYQGLLDTMANIGSSGYSTWEIGEKLPYSSTDLTATLSYFDKIIWYSGYTGSFTYHEAEGSINTFIERGGHFFLNFATFADTAISWFPINKVIPLNPGGDINSGKLLIPGSGFENADTLIIASGIAVEVKGFESDSASSLYRLQEPDPGDPDDLWEGTPNVCGIYNNPENPNSGNAVIMSIPLFKGYTSVLDTKWEIQSEEYFQIFYSTDFIDAETGWIVGEDGLILKTTDGGATWDEQDSQTTKDLRGVDFINESIGWAVGKTGTILKTEDGGENWIPQVNTNLKTLYSVTFVDENNGWAAGKSGTILRTQDGGENWILLESGTGLRLEDITFINSQLGWCVGAQNTILRTEDGGDNWLSLDSGLDTAPWLYAVYFINSSEGWIVGREGTILKTTNSGNNWTTLDCTPACETETGGKETLYDVFFWDNELGWAVGTNGTIISTFNGGENWDKEYSGIIKDLWSIHFLELSSGRIVGGKRDQGSVILNRISGGGSGKFFNLLLNEVFAQ